MPEKRPLRELASPRHCTVARSEIKTVEQVCSAVHEKRINYNQDRSPQCTKSKILMAREEHAQTRNAQSENVKNVLNKLFSIALCLAKD